MMDPNPVVRDVWRRGLWKAVGDRDLSALGRDRSGGLGSRGAETDSPHGGTLARDDYVGRG